MGRVFTQPWVIRYRSFFAGPAAKSAFVRSENLWLMFLGCVTEPRSMAMHDQVNAAQRVPWNKGKLTGAKPPLRPKYHV